MTPMTSAKALSVFLIDDGERWWVAARTRNRALTLYVKDTQGKDANVTTYLKDNPEITATLLSCDSTLVIDDENEGQRKQTCAQWAAERGEGLLCSSCW